MCLSDVSMTAVSHTLAVARTTPMAAQWPWQVNTGIFGKYYEAVA